MNKITKYAVYWFDEDQRAIISYIHEEELDYKIKRLRNEIKKFGYGFPELFMDLTLDEAHEKAGAKMWRKKHGNIDYEHARKFRGLGYYLSNH